MKDFFKAFLSFGLATSIEKIIAFALLPYFTSYFSTEQYGVIDLLQTMVSTLSIFAVFHLESSLQRYYFDYQDKEKGRLIFTILSVIILGSILVSLLIFVFSNFLSNFIFQTNEYSDLIQVAGLQIPMNNITMICLVMLRFEKKNIQFLTSVILKVTTSLLLIYLFLEIYDLGIMGTLWAYLLSSLISIVYLIFQVRRYVNVSFSEALLVKSLKYCLPQFPARIGNIALIYSNRVFMVGVLTISAIGIFSLSLKLASIVQLIYTAFVLAWTPFMFKKRLEADHKVVFKNVLNLASSLIFLLVVLVSLFVVYILEFFISEEFMDASKYVGALCMSFAIMIFREIVDIGPKYMEKTKFISYTFFCSLIVNILCLYFLIPLLGITGVVLSLIITNSSLLAFSWIISNWLYPIPFEYLKFIILAIPAYCISILTMYIDLNIWLKLFLGLALIIFYSWYFVSYYKKFAGNKLFTSGNSIIK